MGNQSFPNMLRVHLVYQPFIYLHSVCQLSICCNFSFMSWSANICISVYCRVLHYTVQYCTARHALHVTSVYCTSVAGSALYTAHCTGGGYQCTVRCTAGGCQCTVHCTSGGCQCTVQCTACGHQCSVHCTGGAYQCSVHCRREVVMSSGQCVTAMCLSVRGTAREVSFTLKISPI